MPLRRDPLRRLLSESRSGARKRGIAFNLIFEDIVEMFERAQGRCEVTGIPFNDTLLSGRVRPWKASIDRIDSEEGYHPENCRLVCVAVNAAMREWGEQILWTIANALVSRILERAYVEEEGPEGRPREMGGEENAGVA